MVNRDDQKRQVQAQTDLVRLIGEQIALKPQGREFLGLCPFHDDHSPSMRVSPAKQIYKCFSCGAGGDAFSFVMSYHKMAFPEALKYLADRAGIQLSEEGFGKHGDQQNSGADARKRIGVANEQAGGFFQTMLRHEEYGQVARDYIAKRSISPQMVQAFGLGYAPDRWDGLVQAITAKRWAMPDFEQAGLVSPRREGPGAYDRFRHRLIFPIYDALNRLIAFGARQLRAEDDPKYLNSPETALFNKSATLYGLHLAKKAIIDTRTAVIVEGYTDVIACHQAGLTNVVATLGTAMTAQHVAELRRYAQKVVLVYDGDAAGQKAADRAVELFLTGSVDVFLAIMPDEIDPADLLLQEQGVAQWSAIMNRATDAFAFQLQRVGEQLEASQTLSGREVIVEEYLRRLARLGMDQCSAIRRSMIVSRLSEMLRVPAHDLSEQLRRLRPAPRATETMTQGEHGGANDESSYLDAPEPQTDTMVASPSEACVVGCLLRDPDLFHRTLPDGRVFDEAMTPQDFGPSAIQELFVLLYEALAQGQRPTLRELVSDLVAQGRQDLANVATTVEQQVEQGLMSDDSKLKGVFDAAVGHLLQKRLLQSHERTKQKVMENLRERKDNLAGTDQEKLLQQMIEQRRSTPVTTRIAKLNQ